MTEVDAVLRQVHDGDAGAVDALLPIVYQELRRLAVRRIALEKPGQTLQPTELVHEVYLRLLGNKADVGWESRGHFFAAAAEAMRRILIDRARRKKSLKRGGTMERRSLDDLDLPGAADAVDLLAMDEVLQRFEALEPRKAQVVKLRYFVGMTLPEVAEALGISKNTADRDWAYARAWLHAELSK